MSIPRIRFTTKQKGTIKSLIILAVTGYVAYQYNLFTNLFFEPLVRQSYWYLPTLFSSITFSSIYLYNLFLQKVYNQPSKFTKDWDKDDETKRQVQIASVALIVSSFGWTFSLWPIYSFLTPAIGLAGFAFLSAGLSFV